MPDDLIRVARERFTAAYDAAHVQREKEAEWLRFRQGDQWSASIKNARGYNRPVITSNQCTKYLRQVTGDARNNKISIKIRPVDDGADINKARILQGLVKHIEQKSNAEAAYDNAIDHAATIGTGYIRVVTRYARPKSFDLELGIERVVDPLSVYIDPAAQKPCAEDMMYAFISTMLGKDEFHRSYPKAAHSTAAFGGIGTGTLTRAELWATDKVVRVCEYFYIEEKPKKLLQLSDGSVVWSEDYTDEVRAAYVAAYGDEPAVINERASAQRTVKWVKMTGAEVLEENVWPGRYGYIPIVPVYGEELWVDGAWQRNGLIKHLKDPQSFRNYGLAVAVETIALSPKSPYIGAEGQFEGHEAEWASANSAAPSYLEYKPVTAGGQVVGAPQRAMPPVISDGALKLVELSEHDMQGAVGIYSASLGERSNETSGKAIMARQREGDTGTYVYHDQLARSVRHVGVIVMDSIPVIYTTPRVEQIIGDDGEPEPVKVNAPTKPASMDKRRKDIDETIYDLTTGEYDVSVDVGPAYASRRAEATDRLLAFASAIPAAANASMDIIASKLDIEESDRLAKRLKALLPPEILKDEAGPEEQPQVPPQVQQAIKMMEADFDRMQAQLEQTVAENYQLRQMIDNKQMENETKITVAQIDSATSLAIAKAKADVDLMIAGLKREIDTLKMAMPKISNEGNSDGR